MKPSGSFLVPVLLAIIYLISYSSHPISNAHAGSLLAQQPQPVVPLEGLDPILLAQGKEVMGKMTITVTRGRYQYVFASEENKTLFEKSPEQYEIQLGGTCARMGPQVGGNADLYSVYQGHIYIFGSGGCKNVFDAAPEKYLEPAAPKALEASADNVKKGRVLIEKAAAAMGGAALVAGVKSYQETSSSTALQQQKPVEVKTVLTRVFPDQARREQVRSFGTIIVTVSPAGSFSVFQSATATNVNPLAEPAQKDMQKQLVLTPLEVVRLALTPSVPIAHLGTAKLGDVTVEEVNVLLNGSLLRIGIDPVSGRLLSLAYRGRGRSSGEFGEVMKTFADFRTVDGLTVPFKTSGTFNGQPEPEQNLVIESMSVNPKIDPAIFEKPKQTGAK